MSCNGAALVAIAVVLLAGCAERQSAQPTAAPTPASPGACGIEAPVPGGATLVAEDAGVGGVTSSRFTVLGEDACGGAVARRPDRCESFPWASEENLYALGGRGWLVVGLGSVVREQIVFYASDSSFADSYAQAALDCGFSTLTVLDGEPVTLERDRGGRVEVVYMTPRSVIWMSSVDPGVGVADLVRLASLAERRSMLLKVPA